MNASRFSPCRRGSSVQLRSEIVRWASRYSAFSAGASSCQRRRCSGLKVVRRCSETLGIVVEQSETSVAGAAE
jgi:hypothetical protein